MRSLSLNRSASPTRRTPSLFYRVTGLLNVIVWRVPLPRRVLARLSQTVYRSPPMPGEAVVAIIGALRGGGVRCWISGGWGVDALVREHTRAHRDLDLILDSSEMERAVEILGDLGYWEWYRIDSDVPLESRVVLHDHDFAGRAIDLHPVQSTDLKIDFAAGAIEGQPVPCISVDWQLKIHSGYRTRRYERPDLAALHRLREAVPTAAGARDNEWR